DRRAHPFGAALLPVRHRRGAAAVVAVVRADAAARGAGARRIPRGQGALHARALDEGLRGLAREHPGLVHLAPALVGSPHPGVVLPRGSVWRDDRRAGGPDALPALRLRRDRTGSGRAGHLVLLVAVAVLDARLAGRDGGPEGVLPDEHAGH